MANNFEGRNNQEVITSDYFLGKLGRSESIRSTILYAFKFFMSYIYKKLMGMIFSKKS